MDWSEKKILITGGTRGIGRAILLELYKRGVRDLVVAAEEEKPFNGNELSGMGVKYICADLETSDAPGRLVENAAGEMGGIDGLVHSAGVYLEGSSTQEMDPVEVWNKTVNIKARAGYLLAWKFAELARDWASFVGVTSINAEQSEPDHLAYDPACAALGGVIRAFAIQHAPRLRFNALAPGLIQTRLTEAIVASSELKKAVVKNIPMGEIGKPRDCAGAAAFLLSDDASYITGETIFVDGGIRANQMSKN